MPPMTAGCMTSRSMAVCSIRRGVQDTLRLSMAPLTAAPCKAARTCSRAKMNTRLETMAPHPLTTHSKTINLNGFSVNFLPLPTLEVFSRFG
jgi:hypothetical protein